MPTLHWSGVAMMGALLLGSCERPPQGQERYAPQSPAPDTAPRREVLRRAIVPPPEAASARLFVHVGDFNDPDKEFIEPAGRRLSEQQRKVFEEALTVVGYDRAPHAVAACFVPHHFLRYYDRAGQQVGEIAICFCCDGVSAKPDMVGPVPTGVGDIQVEFGAKLQSVIEAMGLPTNVRCD
ncbi:hypothetical protein [Brevundimonas sp.]|uniref:hypothetical protein n=1 Tax=Brevundimonas sp. TaxID=1871086 RepID=UPI00289F040F|nr:hypothetical protein [Brevundimonas sp.]